VGARPRAARGRRVDRLLRTARSSRSRSTLDVRISCPRDRPHPRTSGS
jgi:hypothetical protein